MDYHNLIGIPYDRLNCWELCQKFYKQVFNIDLDTYYDGKYYEDKNYAASLIRANQRDFIKVDKPEFGDLITIKIKGVECHIAVFLGKGLMLHTSKSTGSCIDRVGRWNNMIVGYYRVEK